ncbi:MAG: 23S rRNA (uracil(1939)-C(5))-methyltransferase RlmD [Candidatus Marinimicrobia bacterium]|jgi:23S rRNA (uracil1939-C5)-methyltransferase|nr:23S rRNA (uracil(1939)-C(5))-methyltransferase RlmD [Candidatus Neomarinimicrobiota bacterium]MDP6789180.1 23S rRNA (uracil(1939)-C(5))-methyltransferase RlmD [Candidatus Neomarinimicrobiota bacterium]MDP7072810.1 23S rRNA (uracil(1939)-C(5))-methyltransferase RlmD [Candidatus Neomarinimicrobiota bacterium]
MNEKIISKGSKLDLTIESLAFGGRGVAKVNGFVVFVKNAIPGQTVRSLIYNKRKGFAEARPLEILSESENAVEAPCKHFSHCGGCTIQNLEYEEQLRQKQAQVEGIFQHQAGIEDFALEAVVPADETYHYRNKMEFSFSNRRWVLTDEPEGAAADFALGLHIPGRYDKILDISECHIQQPLGNEILNHVRSAAVEQELKPYDVKTHIGFLRHLVLRFGVNTGNVMVNIVTSYENTDLLNSMAESLSKAFPQITSIVNNVNTRKGDTAYGEKEILLYGVPSITEKLGDLTFEISANSFFQTNTKQAEKLYETALNGCGLTGKEIVYDLYCGTGSISLFLAKKTKEVHGFEWIVSAIEDAVRNAVNNGIGNAFFHKANLDRPLDGIKDLPKPDIIVLDPPRAGVGRKTLQYVSDSEARRIVYVSCNPSTQARDVVFLQENGFTLSQVTMVDMFPHTPHIETVAVLEKT